MVNKTPVHVLSQDEGWAVVREGNERATSVHATQAEAAKAGREVARRDGTTFLLHAKDGRVRDRSDYSERSSAPKKRPKGSVPAAGNVASDLAGAATRATGGAVVLTSGIVGGAVDGLGRATQGGTRADEPAGEETDDTNEEVGGLAYEERYADYEVYDRGGERLGNVDTLFLDEDDRPEYIGIKMGLLGTRSTLLPWSTVTRADEEGGRLLVAVDKKTAENGPAFEDDQEITPELERKVYSHYGLEQVAGAEDRGDYGDYYSGTEQTGTITGTPSPDIASLGAGVGGTEVGAFREHDREGRNLRKPGTDPEDEIRVQRSEEELVAGTTRREVGALRVRKRVRIERERLEVPVRREEVSVERVPVTGEAIAEAEISEDEVVVPIVEEEIVVSKRPVVKEEVRIKKHVVEETEIVEEDVRREEIDVEDDTSTRHDI